MTEFEINKKVAEKLGIVYECDMGTVIICRDSGYHSFDPCNNVEQAWEIMLKYNICVTREPDGDYTAFKNLVVCDYECTDWHYDNYHKKPLVAAMLVFLEL